MEAQLDAQCNSAKNFPFNCRNPYIQTQVLESQYQKLRDEEQRIFCVESKASLNFLDFGHASKGLDIQISMIRYPRITFDFPSDFWPRCVSNISSLREHLGVEASTRGRDPWCRFL